MEQAKQEAEDVDSQVLNSRLIKARPCLIKFKSMAEILMEGHAWFDGHGNLCKIGFLGEREHLAPIYFKHLGSMQEFKDSVSFPHWCIRQEYADIFEPNMALRLIASGKFTKEQMIEAAKKAVIVP